MKSGQIFPLQ